MPCADVESLIRTLPGARIVTSTSGSATIQVRYRTSSCIARLYIDGRETDYDAVSDLTPAVLAAVEVFNSPADAPLFTQASSLYGGAEQCGVLLFWTKKKG